MSCGRSLKENTGLDVLCNECIQTSIAKTALQGRCNMICYRDMTFCPFDKCEKFGECERALTEKVKKGAKAWMPLVEDPPVCLFAHEPECFE